MILSIVIPVYNLEALISRCLNSVLDQDFGDFEVIVVDDGSSDATLSICNQFAAEHGRIKVFSQENSGVSTARNRGIAEAKGDWICFVDGDDFIEKNSLRVIFRDHRLGDYDCLILRSYTNDGEKRIEEKYPFSERMVGKTFEGQHLAMQESYFRGSTWGVIFRRDRLAEHNIQFAADIKNGEDTLFFSLVLIYFKSITFLDVQYYNVFERPGSASRSWTFDRVNHMIHNLKYINSYIQNQKTLTADGIKILHYNFYRIISTIYNSFSQCFSLRGFFLLNLRIKKQMKFRIDVGSINIPKKKVSLLNRSVYLFGISVLVKNTFKK